MSPEKDTNGKTDEPSTTVTKKSPKPKTFDDSEDSLDSNTPKKGMFINYSIVY